MNQNDRDNRDDVIEIDLVELLGVILHNLWIIIVSGVIVAAVALLVSYFIITPKYESVTKIYVISKTNADTMTYSDLQAGSTLTKDYKELVKSRPVLEEVLAETGIDVELKDLEAQITVEVPQDTRIVSITVEDKDPYEARIIADSVRIAASKHIREVMDTEAVNVVEEASLPIEKSSPSILKNTAIGYAVGLFLAIAIVIINYIMDDTINSENDLSDKAEMERYEKKKKQRKKKQKEEKVFGKDEPMSEAARIHEERRMQNVKATPESRIKEFSITDLDETNV